MVTLCNPTAQAGRATLKWSPRTTSRWLLIISKKGDSTISPGNPCPCLVTSQSGVLPDVQTEPSVSVCARCPWSCHRIPQTRALLHPFAPSLLVFTPIKPFQAFSMPGSGQFSTFPHRRCSSTLVTFVAFCHTASSILSCIEEPRTGHRNQV